MSEQSVYKTTIGRIQQMEEVYDRLWKAVREEPRFLCEDPLLKEMYQTLQDYYESGQWLQDYEADESGELPPDLKRGVLSQDGVYNLLDHVSYLKESTKG